MQKIAVFMQGFFDEMEKDAASWRQLGLTPEEHPASRKLTAQELIAQRKGASTAQKKKIFAGKERGQAILGAIEEPMRKRLFGAGEKGVKSGKGPQAVGRAAVSAVKAAPERQKRQMESVFRTMPEAKGLIPPRPKIKRPALKPMSKWPKGMKSLRTGTTGR